jgi:hypothetical protein
LRNRLGGQKFRGSLSNQVSVVQNNLLIHTQNLLISNFCLLSLENACSMSFWRKWKNLLFKINQKLFFRPKKTSTRKNTSKLTREKRWSLLLGMPPVFTGLEAKSRPRYTVLSFYKPIFERVFLRHFCYTNRHRIRAHVDPRWFLIFGEQTF